LRRATVYLAALLTALFVVASLAPVGGSGAVDVWVAPDCLKVKRDDPAQGGCHIWSPESNKITLKGARNEYLAFQLIVHASYSLSGVGVSASDLVGPSATISSNDISLFREHYLQVTEPSTSMYGDPSSDGTGWYPDPLVPFDAPSGVPRSRSRPGKTRGCGWTCSSQVGRLRGLMLAL